MADGITPAYDAFSQRRDAGTQDRVTERRRVDTYTDPNRYQMPPNRRLFVQANPVDVTVTPSDGMLDKLAEGLAKVKPQLMNYFANKEIERNKASIQEGIKEAMATEAARAGDKQFFDDQWKEYGYNKQTSFMNGEDLGKQLEIDSANRDLNTSWDEWYNDWWFDKQMNNQTPKTRDFLEEWNKAYEPYSRKARTADLVRIDDEKQKAIEATATEHIRRTLEMFHEAGQPIDNVRWQLTKMDMQEIQHWDNSKMNEFQFNAITDLANHTGDIDVFNILYENGGEDGKLPPLHDNPDYTQKIDKAVADLASKLKSQRDAKDAEAKKIDGEIKKLNDQNKADIKTEIGYYEGIAATNIGLSEAQKNLALKKDYFTLYDQTYDTLFEQYNGDYVKAATDAKRLTLLEAQIQGDLDENLVARRAERADRQLNSRLKVDLLLNGPEGEGDNTQGWMLIREVYNNRNTPGYSPTQHIPFWADLEQGDRDYLTEFGKALSKMEEIRIDKVNQRQIDKAQADADILKRIKDQDLNLANPSSE